MLSDRVTIPCQMWLMDRMDRRTATIWGGVVMSVCMVGIGIIFASGLAQEYKAAKYTIIGLIYVSHGYMQEVLNVKQIFIAVCVSRSSPEGTAG